MAAMDGADKNEPKIEGKQNNLNIDVIALLDTKGAGKGGNSSDQQNLKPDEPHPSNHENSAKFPKTDNVSENIKNMGSHGSAEGKLPSVSSEAVAHGAAQVMQKKNEGKFERGGNSAISDGAAQQMQKKNEGKVDSISNSAVSDGAAMQMQKKNELPASDKVADNIALSPAQMADSIIKNGGFGKGEDRQKADMALQNVMEESVRKGTESDTNYINKVNEELAKKGSNLHLEEMKSGGGGGGGIKDRYEEHNEATGKFSVVDNKGNAKDGMKIEASADKVVENGKVVGERSEVRGESGGGGGGWGKQPADRPFKLHDIELYDSGDTTKGGGGGSKGGQSPMGGGKGGQSPIEGGSKGGQSPMAMDSAASGLKGTAESSAIAKMAAAAAGAQKDVDLRVNSGSGNAQLGDGPASSGLKATAASSASGKMEAAAMGAQKDSEHKHKGSKGGQSPLHD